MVTLKNPGAVVVGGAIVLAFGAIAVNQYITNKEVATLKPNPVVLEKVVVVTPTTVPTATPSAIRIFTPASATRGVVK